jgi:hypothetical protein
MTKVHNSNYIALKNVNTYLPTKMRARSNVSPTKAPAPPGAADPTVAVFESSSSIPTTSSRRRKRKQQRPLLRPRQLAILSISVVVGLVVLSFLYIVSRLLHITTSPTHHEFYQTTPEAPSSCSAPLTAEDVSYTLVTQMNDDRLWMMEHHCERWSSSSAAIANHPWISIAVLTESTHGQVWHTLTQELHCPPERLTLTVVPQRDYPNKDDYPVNVLRNLAFQKVQTSHIVYVDVDFWESTNLASMLQHNDTIREALANDSKLALVIPAFQLFRQCKDWIDCRENNIPLMAKTLEELYTILKSKKGHKFDPTNKGGHGSTRYKDWLVDQDEGELLDIECVLSNRYEPFVVIRYCQELPPFQEAFSGYGKNKMTWMMQLIRTGYRLSQIGGAFLIHYPHLDSNSRMHWNEAPKELVVATKDGGQYIRRPEKKDKGLIDFNRFKRGQVDATFVEFRNWLYTNVPDQRRIFPCKDAQDDDSKLWIDRSKQYAIPNPVIPHE